MPSPRRSNGAAPAGRTSTRGADPASPTAIFRFEYPTSKPMTVIRSSRSLHVHMRPGNHPVAPTPRREVHARVAGGPQPREGACRRSQLTTAGKGVEKPCSFAAVTRGLPCCIGTRDRDAGGNGDCSSPAGEINAQSDPRNRLIGRNKRLRAKTGWSVCMRARARPKNHRRRGAGENSGQARTRGRKQEDLRRGQLPGSNGKNPRGETLRPIPARAKANTRSPRPAGFGAAGRNKVRVARR